jgi:hypothetical protein
LYLFINADDSGELVSVGFRVELKVDSLDSLVGNIRVGRVEGGSVNLQY